MDNVDAAEASVAANQSTLALARRRPADDDGSRRPTPDALPASPFAAESTPPPRRAIFTLVVTEEWFVSGNFRETDLARIKVGTCATAWSLIDRTRPIAGRVEGIGFGVSDSDRINVPRGVPYVEKSVNWVRVQQRFPVRVRLENPPADLMRLGASAYVTIRSGQQC